MAKNFQIERRAEFGTDSFDLKRLASDLQSLARMLGQSFCSFGAKYHLVRGETGNLGNSLKLKFFGPSAKDYFPAL